MIKEIARGGMGVVFEVVHQDIGHRAAMKVLSAALSKDPEHATYVARFHDEARAVNLIQHPGIVRIFDFGQLPDGTLYIMMEFLEGGSLWTRLTRLQMARPPARLKVAEAMRITRLIASALAAAHRKSIIHRDLKPDNVLFCADPDLDGGERIKVVDFGVVRFLDSPQRRTAAGIVLGTPTYMSPEQCQGDEISDRTDVYALGAILYEMLAGTPPFPGNDDKTMVMHVNEQPPPLDAAAPSAPPELVHLTFQMLAKVPGKRPTMDEVVRRLAALDDGGGGGGDDALPAGPGVPASRSGPGRVARRVDPTQMVRSQRRLPWAPLLVGFLGALLGALLTWSGMRSGAGSASVRQAPPPPHVGGQPGVSPAPAPGEEPPPAGTR